MAQSRKVGCLTSTLVIIVVLVVIVMIISVIMQVSRPTPSSEPPSFVRNLPPDISKPAPAVSRPTLPGLQAADVRLNLEQRNFSCVGPRRSDTGAFWTCRTNVGEVFVTVQVFGSSPMRIEYVTATVGGPEGDLSEVARSALGFVATLPYEGAEPDRARAWTEKNVGRNRSMTFGRVRFRLYSSENARSLDMRNDSAPE